MHHCCNAVLEMVTELCPLFSHPSGLAEAVQEIHRLLPAFGIPNRRADATWKGAGRAGRDPAELHPGSISLSLCLTRCHSHVKLQVAPRAAGEGLGSLFLLPFLASVCPQRDVSIHMNQQQLCKYKPLESSICLCSHMGQPETATAREQNMRS